ncbi:MAG: hypothetical protein H6P99_536 [Holophagaceae bacterium]|nr:hypothetical protein [Holophagaceae bacterium]
MTIRTRGTVFFPLLFGMISLLFVSILVLAYHFSKKANPVMLDDQGRPQATRR